MTKPVKAEDIELKPAHFLIIIVSLILIFIIIQILDPLGLSFGFVYLLIIIAILVSLLIRFKFPINDRYASPFGVEGAQAISHLWGYISDKKVKTSRKISVILLGLLISLFMTGFIFVPFILEKIGIKFSFSLLDYVK
ncbi:hypothetical protein A3A14_01165 [Candidatus Daviesbacteria bacterium RIFCSPLOWO2_01_FULL_43_38]|uniref:Uncharacterized protein n=1 Tax=Candidatus Daviesbacteria bacterium RIFCSPHIGHO2_12_FULL_43_11 TaxID=1797780 RepID=A0A1F5K2Q8_9BACT|nr:MAG: hypothetical protein A2874_01190 [Candidatus Daviesbacteria bacterium RIFCSPHIGHO2_01_FULL_43_17]OGE35193.1 MAG: hypothetical protein A3E45_02830 [Candidatus Daviesbacteria bacterium RIFCSPHIGHO2_12_FULL_43_11]OGE63386.1 MAG: hypothetical protein A3A14_01165 [Candidatus Daviesbacteria bacterium RIFCSPLOWO2_01_FULL_43_38]OGE70845.1 MAG: hypothetical protein A3J21_00515 [Candidatus Daviesbacteria bacterium RIFCSPLOWO2_02_FULL_43_11]